MKKGIKKVAKLKATKPAKQDVRRASLIANVDECRQCEFIDHQGYQRSGVVLCSDALYCAEVVLDEQRGQVFRVTPGHLTFVVDEDGLE